MSEIQSPAELEILLSKVHDFNQMMDMRQAAMLAANALKVPKNATEADFEAVTEQQRLLTTEYPERQTMADKFALLLDDRFTYMNSLDVAETSRPASHDELQRVKDEYHDLLDQLVEAGVVDGEIPRSEDSRSIMFMNFEYDQRYAQVTRKRHLLKFKDAQGRQMSLVKWMIFLMPRQKYTWNGEIKDQQVILDIEDKLDNQDPSIIPMRTVYYGKCEDD